MFLRKEKRHSNEPEKVVMKARIQFSFTPILTESFDSPAASVCG